MLRYYRMLASVRYDHPQPPKLTVAAPGDTARGYKTSTYCLPATEAGGLHTFSCSGNNGRSLPEDRLQRSAGRRA